MCNGNERRRTKQISHEVKNASHIEEYCKRYQDFIKREIEIINPDVSFGLVQKLMT